MNPPVRFPLHDNLQAFPERRICNLLRKHEIYSDYHKTDTSSPYG